MVSGSTLTLQDTYLSSSANVWNTATTASLLLQVREDNTLIYDLSQSIFPTSPTTDIAQNVAIGGNKVYDIYGSIKNLVIPTTTTTSTTTTTTTVASTSWSARYDVVTGSICSQTPVTVYTVSGAGFTTGDTVYTDNTLTTPLIGYNYISELITGTIFNINNGTGVIGTSTGNTC